MMVPCLSKHLSLKEKEKEKQEKVRLSLSQPLYYWVNNIKGSAKYKPHNKRTKHLYSFKLQGQLKLLLNEIRFLTDSIKIHNRKVNERYIILYIGSAPGLHIPYLRKLYSKYNIEWHLYDKTPHCNEIVQTFKKPNMVNSAYFLEKDIEFFLRKKRTHTILFISDIRTTTSSKSEPTTQNLIEDYKLQWNIVKKLRPEFSLLKFRLPFPDDWKDGIFFNFPYGEQYLQAFTDRSSNEFRIVVKENNITGKLIFTKKILIEYEERFAFYNQEYRYKYSADLVLAAYILNLYEIYENNVIDSPHTYHLCNIDSKCEELVKEFTKYTKNQSR